MIIKLTENQYSEAYNENGGFCLACGAEAYDCEPDARNYVCEECGAPKVFGAEELLVMGRIEFVD